MTTETHLRELVQAALDGKQIEYFSGKDWIDAKDFIFGFDLLLRRIMDGAQYFRLTKNHTIEYTNE